MASLLPETIKAVCRSFSQVETPHDQYKLHWRNLNEQRKEGLLCDIVIQCGGGITYPAHKCLLAAVSPYFKALFLSPVSNTGNTTTIVNFEQFSRNSIELLLDIIYGESTVGNVDLEEILMIGEFIQYDWLINALVDSIRKTINERNCFAWHKMGQKCGVEKLIILTESYIAVNYNALAATEDTQNVAASISQALIKRECILQKEVVFYHNFDSVYVIDLARKTAVREKSGPCCVNKMYPKIPNEEFRHFRMFSFFMYKKQLFIASCYDLYDRDDHVYDSDYCEENTKIEINAFNHCSQEYCQSYYIEPCELIGQFYDDDEWCDNYLAVTQLVYNNLDHLYIFLEDEQRIHVVFKFDLKEGHCLSNYIVIISDALKFVFVECKQLGTLLLSGLEHVYNLEEFQFEYNEDAGENDHSIDLLKINMLNTHCQSGDRNGKGEKSEKRSYRMWNAVSLNGTIYLFVVFEDNKSKMAVFYLNVEELTWVCMCFLPICGDLMNAFCCEGKIFVVLSSLQYVNFCDCSGKDCMHQVQWGESSVSHTKRDVDEHVYCFNHEKKTLTNTDIRLPQYGESYRTSIVPAYLLL